jgi:preprotein translocase subunit SecD
VDAARQTEADQVMKDWVGQWSLSGSAGGFRAQLPPTLRAEIERLAVDATLETLRNRVDALGVKEPIVQKQGARGDRILIQLPGVEDPQRAKEILQDPARLEWKAVIYPPGVVDYGQWIPPSSEEAVKQMFGGTLPAGVELIGQRFGSREGGGTAQIFWPLSSVSVVVGNDLRSAHRGADQLGRSTVDFQLTPEAGRRFGAATREYVGKKMAIVLGNKTQREVISAPVIRDEIRDRGQISGSFDVKSAEDLSLKLRSGAIPANVSIIEERTVGPSLGRDSIRAGVLASAVGFLGVAVFMFVYYRLSGLNAVVALLMNVVLLMGALGYFGATLTLPGIAGLILTVGMAVDSNILIFERIREELRAGKVVRTAIDQGFDRAFATIIDTHVTTLVSAIFLLTYGTGPVRGFAVTLIIGLILSMFTAVFVSRVIYDLVLGDRKVESLSI